MRLACHDPARVLSKIVHDCPRFSGLTRQAGRQDSTFCFPVRSRRLLDRRGQVREGFDRLAGFAVEQVPVPIHCQPNIAVPQDVLDDVRVNTCETEPACPGVSESMKIRHLLKFIHVPYTGLLQVLCEHVAGPCRHVEGQRSRLPPGWNGG